MTEPVDINDMCFVCWHMLCLHVFSYCLVCTNEVRGKRDLAVDAVGAYARLP